MSNVSFEIEDDSAPCECGNCDWRGTAGQVQEIADVQERLNPGCTVPAGQCPECGALAYLAETETDAARDALSALRAFIPTGDRLLSGDEVNGGDLVEWVSEWWKETAAPILQRVKPGSPAVGLIPPAVGLIPDASSELVPPAVGLIPPAVGLIPEASDDDASDKEQTPETALANVLHFAETFVADWEDDEGMDKESRAECEAGRRELDAAEPILKRVVCLVAELAGMVHLTDGSAVDYRDEVARFARIVQDAQGMAGTTAARTMRDLLEGFEHIRPEEFEDEAEEGRGYDFLGMECAEVCGRDCVAVLSRAESLCQVVTETEERRAIVAAAVSCAKVFYYG